MVETVALGKAETPALWRDGAMLIGAQGLKRVYMLYLMRALDRLSPGRVLEVGCGNGLNLLLLPAAGERAPVAVREPAPLSRRIARPEEPGSQADLLRPRFDRALPAGSGAGPEAGAEHHRG